MASYVTFRAYDADQRYPAFIGLNQHGDLINGNPCYAEAAENMDTVGGVLQPFAAPVETPGELSGKIETLMRLHRRWENDGTNAAKDILVAASDGLLYVKTEDDDSWAMVDMPNGIDRFESNVWSWVTYELNIIDGVKLSTPMDVLLISNAYDGMFVLMTDNGFRLRSVETPYKFGIIERYAERIWGGNIIDEPDTLAYSEPQNPIGWRAADPEKGEQFEDFAGDVRQPSWDGDSFTSIKSFGGQLMAFKRNRVWRIMGTDPGEFTFKEQYGGGCPYPYTIAVDTNRILMLSSQGMEIYDGNTVEPYQQEAAESVWRKLSISALSEATGILYRDKYYLAIPLENSDANSAVMVYSMKDGSWLLRTDLSVESWLATEDHLYFTTSKKPNVVFEYIEDAWESGKCADVECFWQTPWTNLGSQKVTKSAFRIFMMPEVQDEYADLTIRIETDRRNREKTVRIRPLDKWEKRMGIEARTITVPFEIKGRRFRITLKSDGKAVWRLTGGIVVSCDIESE